MIARLVVWLLLILFAASCVFGYGVYSRRIAVPERYDPFTPFDVRAPQGPFRNTRREW